MHVSGSGLSQIKFAGRQKTEGSVKCYLLETSATLAWTHLKAQQQQCVDNLFAPASQLTLPPVLPWRSLFTRRRQLVGMEGGGAGPVEVWTPEKAAALPSAAQQQSS